VLYPWATPASVGTAAHGPPQGVPIAKSARPLQPRLPIPVPAS